MCGDDEMAKLYYRYGAMGSSKTANALMVEYNYGERGKRALLVKPRLDSRDGDHMIRSRIGLEREGVLLEELTQMSDVRLREYDCIILDEAQFATKEQVEFLVHIVDDLDIPVICYGLRTDFRHEFFEGSKWLMAWADKVEQRKTVCWCGRAANCTARIGEDGRMVRIGDQVVMGGDDRYVALCRKHYNQGDLGPGLKEPVTADTGGLDLF